jgi:hypothetical protein
MSPAAKITKGLLLFPTERDVILCILIESIHSNRGSAKVIGLECRERTASSG